MKGAIVEPVRRGPFARVPAHETWRCACECVSRAERCSTRGGGGWIRSFSGRQRESVNVVYKVTVSSLSARPVTRGLNEHAPRVSVKPHFISLPKNKYRGQPATRASPEGFKLQLLDSVMTKSSSSMSRQEGNAGINKQLELLPALAAGGRCVNNTTTCAAASMCSRQITRHRRSLTAHFFLGTFVRPGRRSKLAVRSEN